MTRYWIRSALSVVPTITIAAAIVFVALRFLPGDAAGLMLAHSPDADAAALQRLGHALELERPLWAQFFQWTRAIVVDGDLGRSLWRDEAVAQVLRERFPVTFELTLLALAISLVVAIPAGLMAAARRGRFADHVVRVLCTLFVVTPAFWVGTLVIVLPSVWWGWAPSITYVPFTQDPIANLQHMIVPATVLGLMLAGSTMRITRTMVLEVLRQGHVQTARAKGLPEHRVLVRHALRNAMVPVVALIAVQAPLLMSGAVVVERIFSVPGLGMALLDAVAQRDYPIVAGVALCASVAAIACNLLSDFICGLIDPRIRWH